MSTMMEPSPTSTRRKTTNGLSVDDLQIERLRLALAQRERRRAAFHRLEELRVGAFAVLEIVHGHREIAIGGRARGGAGLPLLIRSEEHTSELQSPYVSSDAVFC